MIKNKCIANLMLTVIEKKYFTFKINEYKIYIFNITPVFQGESTN